MTGASWKFNVRLPTDALSSIGKMILGSDTHQFCDLSKRAASAVWRHHKKAVSEADRTMQETERWMASVRDESVNELVQSVL